MVLQDALQALSAGPHQSHPSIGHLMLLVFSAVLEVVCVSLPGFILAYLGHFDAEKQKFISNLNIQLFTPCLIFIKLASQLSLNKLADLAVIPVLWAIQTAISWACARFVSRCFAFNRRQTNFVTAMGVFGNSNSLPISLVVAFSQTLKGLHWDRIPGDNDDDVAARGILYLLLFQQLGQIIRWSWGFNVLLRPKSEYPEYREIAAEEGEHHHQSDRPDERSPLLADAGAKSTAHDVDAQGKPLERHGSHDDLDQYYWPEGRTPVAGGSRASPADSEDERETANGSVSKKGNAAAAKRGSIRIETRSHDGDLTASDEPLSTPTPTSDIVSFPRIVSRTTSDSPDTFMSALKLALRKKAAATKSTAASGMHGLYDRLPRPAQRAADYTRLAFSKTYAFLQRTMNPPLWAMVIAITVASIPKLQALFFAEGSFVNNSITSAIRSSAGVAVPLILVVLGANLARTGSELAAEGKHDPEEARVGNKLLAASLISRMLLPTLIMAPVLALAAKYVPVSILDDPIFVIVTFLLAGAPTALQLAQICQLNEVYEGVMSRLLFQSYVVWILPSTMFLVGCALEVVEWAAQGDN